MGAKLDAWINAGYETYSKRLPGECRLVLTEIAVLKRSRSADIKRLVKRESDAILAAVPRGAKVVALDVLGQQWSTPALAKQLKKWLQSGQDVALLVGGPEGLSSDCRARADTLWSLSPLTLPHALVRVLVAEQIYRAWSILNNHPYHRQGAL